MKITFNGETIRDNRGQYAKSWIKRTYWNLIERIKTALRYSAIIAAFGWAVVGGYMLRELDNSRTIAYAATSMTTLAPIDIRGKTIDQLEDEVINELAHNENGDGTDLPVYLDDNSKGTLSRKDKPSYGCMAYKLSTVQRHYKAIHGKDINNLEAALLALNCPQAKELAKDAIFHLNAINEWMGATERMKVKVSVIREML